MLHRVYKQIDSLFEIMNKKYDTIIIASFCFLGEKNLFKVFSFVISPWVSAIDETA